MKSKIALFSTLFHHIMNLQFSLIGKQQSATAEEKTNFSLLRLISQFFYFNLFILWGTRCLCCVRQAKRDKSRWKFTVRWEHGEVNSSCDSLILALSPLLLMMGWMKLARATALYLVLRCWFQLNPTWCTFFHTFSLFFFIVLKLPHSPPRLVFVACLRWPFKCQVRLINAHTC